MEYGVFSRVRYAGTVHTLSSDVNRTEKASVSRHVVGEWYPGNSPLSHLPTFDKRRRTST